MNNIGMKITRPSVTLEAVCDGCGESATWGLYLIYGDGFYGEPVELKWPKLWPDRVTGKQLESWGYEAFWA